MHTYTFEKLEVWRVAREFISHIYRITSGFPKEELFGLTSQTRRAAVSIAANLAEGSSRKSLRDQARFTVMSYSSALEVLSHIIIGKDLNYLTEEEYGQIREKIEKITNMLNALSKAQKSRIK